MSQPVLCQQVYKQGRIQRTGLEQGGIYVFFFVLVFRTCAWVHRAESASGI
jgi:hypothetical protein